MIQYEKNAVQKMEDFQVFSVESGGRANRLADSMQNNKKELDFRKRLSGVVCKPPYAALNGNFLCGER